MSFASVPSMPDLQLRMSKKIAQLTKVIYHLNNKNEDNELDLAELAEQYETEIEQILKDTADKINHFKAQLDAANDAARIAELTKQIEAKYDDERRRCLTEIESIRKRAAEKEATIQKAATKQIEGLQIQVDELQRQLQARVKEINELSLNANASSQELQGALARARQETEEAIQSHNKRYNDMLAERMRREDVLSEQLEALRRQLERAATVQEQLEAAAVESRVHWDHERSNLFEERKANDASWKGKVEALVEELQREKAAGKDAIKRAADTLAASEASAVARIKQLEGSLESVEAELQGKLTQATRLQGELAALQTSSNAQISTLEQQLEAARAQLDAAAAGAMGDKEAFGAATAAAQAEQQRLVVALNKMEGELTEARTQLKDSSGEVDSLKQLLTKTRIDGDAVAGQLRSRVSTLEEELQRAITAGQSNAQDAMAKMREMYEKQLVEAAEAAKKAVKSAQQERDQLLEHARKDAALRLAGAEGSAKSQLDDMRRKLQQDHSAVVSALEAAHAKALAEATTARIELQRRVAVSESKAAEELKAKEALAVELAELQKRVDASGKDASAAKDQLQLQLAAVTASETKLKDEVAKTKSALAAAEGRAAERLKQSNELKAQLEAANKKAEEDKRSASALLSSEMARLSTELESAVRKARMDADARMAAEMAALRAQLAAAGGAAEASLRSQMDDLRRKMELELEAQRKQAEAEKAMHAQELDELRKQHDKELEKLRSSSADAVSAATAKQASIEEALRAEMAATVAAAVATAEASARKASEALHRQLMAEREGDLAEAKARHRDALEQAEAEAKMERERLLGTHADALKAMVEQNAQELEAAAKAQESALAAAAKQHEVALSTVRASHAAEVAALRGQLERADRGSTDAAKRIAAVEAEGANMATRIEKLTSALASKAAEMTDTVFMLKQDAAAERDALLRSYKADKEALVTESEQLATQLRQQLAAVQADASERFAALEAVYGELKQRFDAREPREEDMRRITELEGAVRRLEELVCSSEERMAQLRAELLLREESYNKHFKNGGAGEKVLNVDSAMHAKSDVVDWMLGNKNKGSKTSGRDGGSGRK